ncbi:MAG: amidohydrolase family protein [Niabella sp.]
MIPIIDTHQHLIYPKFFGYDWVKDIDILNNKSFTAKNYTSAAKDCNIIRSLSMETGVNETDYQKEAMFFSNLSHTEDMISAIISSIRPEDDEKQFDAWLDYCQTLNIKGFRRITHVMPDELTQSTLYRKNLRKIASKGYCSDIIFMASQLDIAAELVAAVNNGPLILNHCGNPTLHDADFGRWAKSITKLSQYPHLYCKISGIIVNGGLKKTNIETIRLYIEHIIISFGWDRIVWGSDWPVCNITSNIKSWVEMCRQIVIDEPIGNQEKLFFKNAQHIYNIDNL